MSKRNLINYNDEILAVHPGYHVEGFLEDWEISLEDFAKRCKINAATMRLLIDGAIPMTPDLAEKLEAATDVSAGTWMNMQHHFEKDLAAISEAVARDLKLQVTAVA